MALRTYAAALAAMGCLAAGLAAGPAGADTLEKIESSGEFVIGSEARYAPFEFVEGGKIVGYGPDLFHEVMKALPEVTVKQLDLPFQGLLPGLAAGKFDAIITAVTVTAQRYDAYRLSLPIADATFAVVKRKGDESIMKPEDVAGKIVGTQTGSAQLEGTKALSQSLEDQGLEPIARIETYVGFSEAYADLAAGRTDAVVNSLPNLLYLQKQRPEIFEVVQPTFGPKKYFAWAFRKDEESRALADLVDAELRELNENGTMAKLQEKWFGFPMDLPSDALPRPEM